MLLHDDGDDVAHLAGRGVGDQVLERRNLLLARLHISSYQMSLEG